jgi:hypothetical protein
MTLKKRYRRSGKPQSRINRREASPKRRSRSRTDHLIIAGSFRRPMVVADARASGRKDAPSRAAPSYGRATRRCSCAESLCRSRTHRPDNRGSWSAICRRWSARHPERVRTTRQTFVENRQCAVGPTFEEFHHCPMAGWFCEVAQETERPEHAADLLVVKDDPAQCFEALVFAARQEFSRTLGEK